LTLLTERQRRLLKTISIVLLALAAWGLVAAVVVLLVSYLESLFTKPAPARMMNNQSFLTALASFGPICA
jgi:uncharacterized membrane protein